MGATRTVNPLHFEDLEPHRFEDLVRQLAHGFRTWRSLEATGRLGRDEGIDIRGVELVQGETPESVDDGSPSEETPAGEERAWTIQCKRTRSFGRADARGAVAQAVPDGADPPYGLVVAVAADATTETVLAFHEAARTRGVSESHLWTKGQLEDLLRLDRLAAQAVHEYIKDFRPNGNPEGSLLLTEEGQPFMRRGFQSYMARLSDSFEAAGIRNWMAHRARHYWATSAHRAGMTVFDIAAEGGWRDIKMVQRYTQRRPFEELQRLPTPLSAVLRHRAV